jgi:hypothetical protein
MAQIAAPDLLAAQLDLADTLRAGRETMFEPQDLPGLVELKLAAGRARDEGDVVELLRANMDRAGAIREHLAQVNQGYAARFDALLARAQEQTDR